MDNFAVDYSDSCHDFNRLVVPILLPALGGGEWDEVGLTRADRDAGIDAYQRLPDGRARGISYRIQWGDDWKSHTPRVERPTGASTELAKRLLALDRIEEGWMMPALVVQAYATKPRRQGELLSLGVSPAAEVYRFAAEAIDGGRELKRNPSDGVLFVPVWWREVPTRVWTRAKRWHDLVAA